MRYGQYCYSPFYTTACDASLWGVLQVRRIYLFSSFSILNTPLLRIRRNLYDDLDPLTRFLELKKTGRQGNNLLHRLSNTSSGTREKRRFAGRFPIPPLLKTARRFLVFFFYLCHFFWEGGGGRKRGGIYFVLHHT